MTEEMCDVCDKFFQQLGRGRCEKCSLWLDICDGCIDDIRAGKQRAIGGSCKK
jgi:hypothetical protein